MLVTSFLTKVFKIFLLLRLDFSGLNLLLEILFGEISKLVFCENVLLSKSVLDTLSGKFLF